MRNCGIKFVNKEITPFGGLSLFFKMLEPKSVIRISLCRTTQRNPNDRFGVKCHPPFCCPSGIYSAGVICRIVRCGLSDDKPI